ncbi:hypothetical protein O181_027137 [Austropuccinia psidii MF-1]|uniref:Uncharacterized protein n=1 Tax=Austropuccinia psidii MF-1 TaxID=1389203 RepID=A0A9Q3H1E5_9BASI|nr:hypothetical protein [Austropuccinia psidii MF-1]
MAKRPKDPQHPEWPYPSRLKPWPLKISRGHQAPSIRGFPSRSGRLLAQLNRPKSAGTRSGACMLLYTIMHHFSSVIQWWPFQEFIMQFRSNYPGKSSTSKEGFRPPVLKSMAATRRPFEEPNSLAFQVLGI